MSFSHAIIHTLLQLLPFYDFNCGILIPLHLTRQDMIWWDCILHQLLTWVFCDIQHFMNFNSHLVSALLQADATFITKGWIPICPWGSQPAGSGKAAPQEHRQHWSCILHPCVTQGEVRNICKLATGMEGWAHGNTDFSNSALALCILTKRYLTLPEHLPFLGKVSGISESLGKTNHCIRMNYKSHHSICCRCRCPRFKTLSKSLLRCCITIASPHHFLWWKFSFPTAYFHSFQSVRKSCLLCNPSPNLCPPNQTPFMINQGQMWGEDCGSAY